VGDLGILDLDCGEGNACMVCPFPGVYGAFWPSDIQNGSNFSICGLFNTALLLQQVLFTDRVFVIAISLEESISRRKVISCYV
jgi:hypothetical protein